MESFILYLLIAFVSCILLLFQTLIYKSKGSSIVNNLPPGRRGWPIIGETLEYFSVGKRGNPSKFVFDRMNKYSPQCFQTSMLGKPMVFLCGPSGHKFLFSNDNKLFTTWHQNSFKKLFPNYLQKTNSNDRSKTWMGLFSQFLRPECLKRNISSMDVIAKRHFASDWEGKDDVFAFPLVKEYIFRVACRIFLNIDEPDQIDRYFHPFLLIASGIISFPINLPGTAFNKAIRAAKFLRKEFSDIISQRRIDLAKQKAKPKKDILSHLLSLEEESGEDLDFDDMYIVDIIFGFLFAGQDPVTAAITITMKYLAELPHIYHLVYLEQMEIAKLKASGELLNWEDIQKMKYSWNVVCEVMRLVPPAPNKFREATTDFTFAGFTIPKGCKIYWSTYSTHHDPQYFPNPEKFDPTRFEGKREAPYTYLPFGGGPGMCPGKEHARFEILVFLHNLVKSYRWEKIVPDEQITISPFPVLTKGLPIRLIPHH